MSADNNKQVNINHGERGNDKQQIEINTNYDHRDNSTPSIKDVKPVEGSPSSSSKEK